MRSSTNESTILSCPLCESHQWDDYTVIGYGSQPRGGIQDFPVLRCRRHGVEFADVLPPLFDDLNLKKALDGQYGLPSGRDPRYIDFMDQVEAVTGRADGRQLHDIGCGNGHLLFEARHRGWRVQGNDIVAGVREAIEKNGIRCWIGALSDLGLRPQSCDVVTSFCVLPHHLIRPTLEMLAVERILKPGGWFILQLPDNGVYRRIARLQARLLWPWRPSRFAKFAVANIYGPGGHQFAYTRRNLKEYIEKCGFAHMIFREYRASYRQTVARFRSRPLWFLFSATAAVICMSLAGHLLRMPNHMIVFARKRA